MKYDIYFGDHEYRFALGRSGKRPLVVIGINPNKADAFQNDPTIRKIEEQLEVWREFDGFLMLNLYPIRASKPELLNQFEKDLAILNAALIRQLLKGMTKPVVWAAWGDNFDCNPFLNYCLREIQNATIDLAICWCQCEKPTENKNPRHPIGGRPHVITAKSVLSDFDVWNYLRRKPAP